MKAALQKKASENHKHQISPDSSHTAEQSPSSYLSPVHNISIQRKPTCPCGGGCSRCKGAMQPKLKISQPGDIYEQEADRVAEQVITSKPLQAPHEGKGQVQRKTVSDAGAAPIADNFIQNLGLGQPLDDATRTFFEPRFGHDFSDVRVHNDAKAAESARAVNARAFTVGSDVVFGSGQYAPNANHGQRLLAHELTHVVQQGQSEGYLQRYNMDNAPYGDPARDPRLRGPIGSPQGEEMTGEGWIHVYEGTETNDSDDYVVAGISQKIGNVKEEIVVAIKPRATYVTPKGWDLDCFIRRDGTAIKFWGKFAYTTFKQELPAEVAKKKFPQYVNQAAEFFSKNPKPKETDETKPTLQGTADNFNQAFTAQLGEENRVLIRPEPTRRQIELDELLRDLARRPMDALVRWRRLRPDEQTIVVTYMAMFYDLDFAIRFREEALRHPNPNLYILITNVDTPENLIAKGYRLRNSSKRVQYWTNPSGYEVWLATPHVEAQKALVPKYPVVNKKIPDAEEIAQVRRKIDSLTVKKDQFVNRARDLRRNEGELGFQQQCDQFWSDYFHWEKDLGELRDKILDLKEATNPDYSTEEYSLLLNQQIETQFDRWDDLYKWNQNDFPELVRDLPPP